MTAPRIVTKVEKMKMMTGRNFFIGIAVIAAGACGYFLHSAIPSSVAPRDIATLDVPGTYDGCSTCPLIVRQMAWSLDNEAELWTTDGYYTSRSDGGSIWTANGDYGIGIGRNAHQTSKLDNEDSRKLLWRAFQRWIINPRRWRP